eukprot:PITA_36140
MIKVFGLPFSACTATVLACLNEKEVAYQVIPVDILAGDHKQPPFLSINPFGEIPAVQDGALTLIESRAIVKYLAKKFQGSTCDLMGRTIAEQAVVEQWCEVESQKFNPPFYAIMEQVFINPMKGLGPTDELLLDRNVEKLGKVLDVYEERLSKSKYLAGDSFTLADLHHLPYLHYLVNAVGKGDLVFSRRNVHAWWEDISSRPAWKKVAHNMKLPSLPCIP